MFETACLEASAFTRPLVISVRTFDTNVDTGMGTFIVLNPDGWILSAAHMLGALEEINEHQPLIAKYEATAESIRRGPGDPKQKRKKVDRLRSDPKWLTHVSYWWANDDYHLGEVHAYPDVDVMVGKLDGFDPGTTPSYPKFKEPAIRAGGASLVKIGFPFHQVATTWDEATGNFALDSSALNAQLFPIEGIHTRTLMTPTSGGYPGEIIETSSPGLRGQSGGPTMDVDGAIWAMQARTAHLPLGFRPEVDAGHGRKVEEHQFLNVGMGVSTATLKPIFDQHGIAVQWVN